MTRIKVSGGLSESAGVVPAVAGSPATGEGRIRRRRAKGKETLSPKILKIWWQITSSPRCSREMVFTWTTVHVLNAWRKTVRYWVVLWNLTAMLMIKARHPLTWIWLGRRQGSKANLRTFLDRFGRKARWGRDLSKARCDDGEAAWDTDCGWGTDEAGGIAADVRGTVMAGRPNAGVIGTNATMMVTSGRAAITAGMCLFRIREYGNDGDRRSM